MKKKDQEMTEVKAKKIPELCQILILLFPIVLVRL